jgi:L-ascorbate metabolism protein UlaG (beta-lactamase superfamily)
VRAAPLVLSTASAHERLGGAVRALPNWTHVDLPRPGGGVLRVTGVPAQHGPDGTEHLVGEVTGFILSGEGLPTVYVSGDNASLDVVRVIGRRLAEANEANEANGAGGAGGAGGGGGVDVALLFAGGAQTALLGAAYLTLTSDAAAEAARILEVRDVVPLHFEHWAHFTQGGDTLVDSFERAGLGDRLHLLKPGRSIDLPATGGGR